MKENVKIRVIKEKSKELYLSLSNHIGVGILGFISSRACVNGGLLPFGLSIAGGCPNEYMPSCAIGVFIGYFIPAVGNGGFRYIAALLAILAIKVMLSNYKKLLCSGIFLSFIVLLSSGITSVVALNGMNYSFWQLFAESLLAGGGTFFINKTASAVFKENAGFSPDEMASFLIVISIFLMGIANMGIYGLSLGRILGVSLILICAKYGGTLVGAISGTAVAFSTALTSTSQGYAAYSFAGMICGVFASMGKYAQIASLAVSLLIGTTLSGENVAVAPIMVELILGSAVFLLIPRNAGITLGKIFSCPPKTPTLSGLKKSLNIRLTMASDALCDVSKTVEQVSKELSKISSPDFSQVIEGIENDACTGCKLKTFCWETKREATVEAVLEMTKAVKLSKLSPEEETTEEFKGRCLRVNKVGEAVSRNYSDYAVKISAENRIEEVRSVISDQFEGISDMLSFLASDLSSSDRFDNGLALNVAAALKNIDIRTKECTCRTDKFGRMTVEFKMKKDTDTVINKMSIIKTLSLVCERNFAVPSVIEAQGYCFITVSERPAYKVDFGAKQLCASKSLMCGDAYNYFYDGRGHFIIVLSDGMGTGGRAAVDGAMASGLMTRLLKAGLGYNCSLNILNSSMIFKSTDESLATLDISSVDLFTGKTDFYKAGAAPTVVRRNFKTGKAESTSLPIGILRDVGFDTAQVKLGAEDIVLMLSDGVISNGTEWIKKELANWKDGSADELAEHIALCAYRQRNDSHEDDITVLAAIIKKENRY